jgi:hypothetical protein
MTAIGPDSLGQDIIGITVHGNGSPITTGEKDMCMIPYACRIVAWCVLTTNEGSMITFGIDSTQIAAFPSVQDIIGEGVPPSTELAAITDLMAPDGWSQTELGANDVLIFNVDAADGITTRASLYLKLQKI